MIINSANLMGGSSEPDGYRGFGRLHLEAGMPLDEEGALGLLVAEATIDSDEEVIREVQILGDQGIELRATLCWIDPPSTELSDIQLVNDLDLVMISPSDEKYTMWESGDADTYNVNERVIVPADSMEDGIWTVVVSAKKLLSEQSYSLVVTGAFRTSKDGFMQGSSR